VIIPFPKERTKEKFPQTPLQFKASRLGLFTLTTIGGKSLKKCLKIDIYNFL